VKIAVAIPEVELDALYREYSHQGGTRTKEEVAEVLAQDIIDIYFSPEYYDQSEIKSIIDDLLD